MGAQGYTQSQFLQSVNDLSDVASVSTSRTNLGLGGAAVLSVGTVAGTVAAGDDSRIVGAIPAALVDAKGDLIVATAADTVARLAVGTAGYVPMADPAAAQGLSWQAPTPDALIAGATTLDRRYSNTSAVTAPSGTLRLAYLTAPRAEPIAAVAAVTGGTAAAATPTLCRYGIYSVAVNGDLTLIASTPNDVTLFAAINTRWPKAFSAGYNAVLGQRYALGLLVISGVATPTFVGVAPGSGMATSMATSPRVVATLGGQTDLPGSILSGALGTTTQLIYGEVF